MTSDLPRRLRGYPVTRMPAVPLHVCAAMTFRARLLGLAGLRSLPDGVGLLLPRTSSVHTFGMRFTLDLLWIGQAGRVIRMDESVPPGRVRRCRHAWGVVERPARNPGERVEPH